MKKIIVTVNQIASEIKLKNLLNYKTHSRVPLLIALNVDQFVVVFRFGVLVFFNVSRVGQEHFIGDVIGSANKIISTNSEEIGIEINSAVEDNIDVERMVVNDMTIPKMQLIAEVLARHIVLNFYENEILTSFTKIENLINNKRKKVDNKELLNLISEVLITKSKFLGKVQLSEKPDVLWDNYALEKFYKDLSSEYEIEDRYITLDEKMDYISSAAGTMLQVEDSRLGHRLEWYIIILIMIDIVISLIEKLFEAL